MSGQLESPHFFRLGDLVRSRDGRAGTVAESRTLFAVILWENGESQEVDQFDPDYIVALRKESE